MFGDNQTCLANGSARCGSRTEAASRARPRAAMSSPLPKPERAGEGSCLGSAAQLGCWRVRHHAVWVRARETWRDIRICERVGVYLCSVTARITQMLYPPPHSLWGGQWSLANVYSAALQAFALHFQTSNFVLIKLVQQRRVPRDQTKTVYVDHRVTRQLQRAVKYTYGDYFARRIVLWFNPHPLKHVVDDGEAVPICESVCCLTMCEGSTSWPTAVPR